MRKINVKNRVSFEAGKKGAFLPFNEFVEVVLEKPGAVFAVLDDEEILIGYGTEFNIRLSHPCWIMANVPGVYIAPSHVVLPTSGEVFTNFDKRPTESPAEQAVTLALRRLNQKMREVDRVRREIDERRHKLEEPVDAPVDEPSEEPVEEPEETPPAEPVGGEA